MNYNVAILIDLLAGLFFLFGLLIGGYHSAYALVPLVLCGYHIWKLWQMRSSPELAFLLIFSITYPIFWILSISLSVDIHYLFWNVDNILITKALAAQGLFLCCLFIGMANKPPSTIALHPRRNSSILFWTCITLMMICLAIVVSSVQGSIFEQSYDYELSGSSILFEYVLILIIIAYAYSGQSKTRSRALIFCSVLFVLAPLYFGKRLPAAMVMFSLLLLFWRPKGLKQVALIFCAGFFSLSLLALFRVGDSSANTLTQILLNVGSEGAMRNNQGGVVYSSAAYMKLVEDGIFDIHFAIESMINTALSIFLPSAMVSEAAYINFSAMHHIPIPGNGGLPGVGFYVWGREIGIVLAGLFFGRLMYKSRYSYLSSIYVTFLLFTFPRWMAYNVNIMFKAGTLLVIGYLITRLVSSVSSPNRVDRPSPDKPEPSN